MNPREHELVYPLAALPDAGQCIEVAPGVRWLRMRLPFALDHINLWLLRDTDAAGRDGWAIIDCGIANAETRDCWERIFADGLGGLPVLRVMATHMHPDHLGNARWLCERWQAPFWISHGEYCIGRILATRTGAAPLDDMPGAVVDAGAADATSDVAHFRRHGLTDPVRIEQIAARRDYFPTLVRGVPPAFVRMHDGQRILIGGRTWQVIVGHGHSPEHVSLYCAEARILISGDMVLPRISTNVSVWPIEPDADPLGLYLASLDRYGHLPADTLVLPSHGKPFVGLHARIAQQHEHHAERLDRVREACARSPHSAADTVPVLFDREFDTHQLTFAMGESLAHLHRLWHAGELQRLEEGGVVRFGMRASA